MISRHAPTDLGDSIMTAIAIAPLAATAHRFASLGVLRKQECERVAALRDELRKCKATVHETVETDTLDVTPSAAADLGGATVATYHDHRMAMCFATLALKVGGIKIEGAELRAQDRPLLLPDPRRAAAARPRRRDLGVRRRHRRARPPLTSPMTSSPPSDSHARPTFSLNLTKTLWQSRADGVVHAKDDRLPEADLDDARPEAAREHRRALLLDEPA